MSRPRSPNDGGCRPRPRRTIAQSIPSESRKFRTLIEIADVVAVTTPTALRLLADAERIGRSITTNRFPYMAGR